jgi:hypothetical protein
MCRGDSKSVGHRYYCMRSVRTESSNAVHSYSDLKWEGTNTTYPILLSDSLCFYVFTMPLTPRFAGLSGRTVDYCVVF